MTNVYTFLQIEIAKLFGDTFEETCNTQMCCDTPFENHWARDILQIRPGVGNSF